MSNNLPSGLQVAVLCGGIGVEREVSLASGTAVAQALEESGADILINKIVLGSELAEVKELSCDVAFIALHGEFGEDGQVQAELEKRDIPYIGSGVEASAQAMDKDRSKRVLAGADVPVADWVIVCEGVDYLQALHRGGLDFPVVVKPNSRGSSVGVSIVKDAEDLNKAVREALENDNRVMIERYIAGRELTVGLLEGKALPVLELMAANGFYDYQAKYHRDDTSYRCPAPLTPEVYAQVQKYAEDGFVALGLRDFARIDFILGDEGAFALEANTIPGFTSHSLLPKAARESGIDFSQLCLRLVGMAANRGGCCG